MPITPDMGETSRLLLKREMRIIDSPKSYIALIADIVNSRELSNRMEVQELLRKTLAGLNRRTPSLVSPYTITLGDEFQALFSSAEALFPNAIEILAALYPVRIRFSFGVGTLLTRIKRREAIGMDGPAFHAARDGMEAMKTARDTTFIVRPDTDDALGLSNLLLRLISHDIEGWNKTRLAVMQRMFSGKSLLQISGELELAYQTVHKTARSGQLRTVLASFNSISCTINHHIGASQPCTSPIS